MTPRKLMLMAVALLAVPIAIASIVLAVDVLRVPGELQQRDTRFESAPQRQAGLWGKVDFLRGWPALRLLGVHDDLDYRRAAGLYLRATCARSPARWTTRAFPSSRRCEPGRSTR